MKIIAEMPSVSKCVINQCVYNSKNMCHAKAITIGDGRSPRCDSFFASPLHIHETKRIAGVGACKIDQCQFNSDYQCIAESIEVGMFQQNIQCLTYVAREETAMAG